MKSKSFELVQSHLPNNGESKLVELYNNLILQYK